MRCLAAPAALLCLFSLGSDASLTGERRPRAAPRVVQLPLQRRHVSDPVAHDRRRLARRGETVQANLDNEKTLYFVNASLGTPPQQLRLHLDTGSSDLWVNTPASGLCASQPDACAESGTYVANSSSTYEYLDSDFVISYVDGSGAGGDYATDTFRFGGVDLPRFQFGVGYTSSSAQGILGVGYPANEAQAATAGRRPYENLPARLLADGHITSNAYSIWLDDLNSTTGSLLFGGVDRSQYRGDLVSVPVQRSGAAFREFLVTMTGLRVGSADVALRRPMAVLLDTGSSLTYLPTGLAADVHRRVGATWLPQAEAAVVPCSLGARPDGVTFSFSAPAAVTVPLSELVIPVSTERGGPAAFADGAPMCLFGISPSEREVGVLGDTFLRSAYVVYDMANNQIALAQSNFDAKPDGADVVAIESGKELLPGATAAPSPVPAPPGPPRATESAAAAPGRFVAALVAATVACYVTGGLRV